MPEPERVLTRSGEPVKKKMTTTPEPKDKLDATATMVGAANGPEGEILDWRQVDWRAVEENVRRLRQRIFTATRAGDLKKVRNLQKLMLRSRANTLVSVRRVTERNAGRANRCTQTRCPEAAHAPSHQAVACRNVRSNRAIASRGATRGRTH